LVGEEAAGLPADVAAGAALRVTVPMPGGMESLNAAMAAAIVIYELSRH
jgi:TrmH family RNA methyltransferase